jgi:hypothetical protein
MKKTVAVITLIVVSAMAGALAEEKWSANALKWRQLTPDERVFYVYGFTTGISYERLANKSSEPPITFADSTRPADIAAAMDAFYAKPENALVCWTYALEITNAAMNGTPKSDAEINLIRKANARAGCTW